MTTVVRPMKVRESGRHGTGGCIFCDILALLAVGRHQSHLSNHCQGACINENVDNCIVAGTKTARHNVYNKVQRVAWLQNVHNERAQ